MWFPQIKKECETDGPTNQRTDQQTDGPMDDPMDGQTLLKKSVEATKNQEFLLNKFPSFGSGAISSTTSSALFVVDCYIVHVVTFDIENAALLVLIWQGRRREPWNGFVFLSAVL